MTNKPCRKTFLSLILLALCVYPVLAQNKRLISGSIVNALNNEPLPFATVALKKLMIGIVTNEEGKFDLYIPEDSDQDTLYISYFGYKHAYIKVNSILGSVNIALEPSAVELKEVVVRPLAAYYYILMAMRKVQQNYPKEPFETEAYYREKLIENKKLIKNDEGVFKTYYPNYLDTIKTQNQLLLHRSTDNTNDLAFMKEERKKAEEKEERKKKKAEAKKGNNQKNDGLTKENNDNMVIDLGSSFGGPESILKSGDLSKKPDAFLDSTQFKSYNYSFAKSSSYNNNELIVIDFSSKGTVNHVRESGKVYIDLASHAIVQIENTGDLIIPALVKPILFLYGIGIADPKYVKKVEFQLIQGRWYPKNILNNIDIKLTNKHWFKPNEHSDFEIEQVFTVNQTKTNKPLPIPVSKRFNSGKDMKTQVHNDDGLSWEGLNIIKK